MSGLKKQKKSKQKTGRDWWNDISKDHQKQIKQAIAEASKGQTIPHTEMVKRYQEYLLADY